MVMVRCYVFSTAKLRVFEAADHPLPDLHPYFLRVDLKQPRKPDPDNGATAKTETLGVLEVTTMNMLKIHKKNLNLEILAIIMDSVAKKIDCRVTYNKSCRSLSFEGDAAFKRYVVEETLALFGLDTQGRPC
jgi:hypothetical protein